MFSIVGWSASLVKLQTTGVAQKNNCINIPNKFEKSGTNVVIADVNLVNAMINAYVAKIMYKTIHTFGINLKAIHTAVAIINKNIDTKLLPINDIIGIASTGNITFFTK